MNVKTGRNRSARYARPRLAVAERRRLGGDRGLLHRHALGVGPLAGARRYRRQHAADAGPRAAERPGLVRSAPISDEPARRLRHPLEPHRRSADRGADPAVQAVRRHGAGRAAGVRDRAADPAPARHRRAQLHRAAAGQPRSLAAGDRVPAGLDRHAADVHARADRPSRLAARVPGRDGRRPRRSQARARRRDRRHRQRGQRLDRAGDAALCGDGGRDRDAALGARPRGRGAAAGLCADARGRRRGRLRRVRVLCQRGRALRRADAGVSDHPRRGGRLAVRDRAGEPGADRPPPRRSQWLRARSSRSGFALLFPQCLGRPEQVSPELAADVAQQRSRGQADLSSTRSGWASRSPRCRSPG